MAGFFYKLGRMVGPPLRKANWLFHSLTGTEADAIRAEQPVGRDLARALVRQAEPDTDPAVLRLLEDLRVRLSAGLSKKPWQFTFRSLRSTEVNAFALPGGFVFVTRPLVQLCRGDRDELAFVLGHEMGHVVLRHAMDRIMANSVLRAALGKLTRGGILGQPVAGLATALLSQGYSREQELEADGLGVRLAGAAGLDPAAAARLLTRLQGLAGDPSLWGSYLSSHPPLEVRIAQVNRLLRGGG